MTQLDLDNIPLRRRSHDKPEAFAGGVRVSYTAADLTNRPSKADEAAWGRVHAALEEIKKSDDYKLIRAWHCNLFLHHMSISVRTLTDAQEAKMKADAEALALKEFPGRKLINSWVWGMGFETGVSVVITKE